MATKKDAKAQAADRKTRLSSAKGGVIQFLTIHPVAKVVRANLLQQLPLPGGGTHRVGRDVDVALEELPPALKKQGSDFAAAVAKFLGATLAKPDEVVEE